MSHDRTISYGCRCLLMDVHGPTPQWRCLVPLVAVSSHVKSHFCCHHPLQRLHEGVSVLKRLKNLRHLHLCPVSAAAVRVLARIFWVKEYSQTEMRFAPMINGQWYGLCCVQQLYTARPRKRSDGSSVNVKAHKDTRKVHGFAVASNKQGTRWACCAGLCLERRN